MKRQADPGDGSISPPTVKRKIESTTTSKAVASFFKPASQKDPEQVIWRIVDQSLIIGKYCMPPDSNVKPSTPRKIAAFDLDDTLISPNAGSKWNRSATGWKWWDATIPGRLKELHMEGYLIVIISNQGNVSLKNNPKALQKDTLSFANLKNQVTSVMRQLDLPLSIYAATGQDIYRKPRMGIWTELLEDYDLESADSVNLSESFYVGDAAGRAKTGKRPKDHACCDRDLAANIGLAFYTPEEYFLKQDPEPFERDFDPPAFLQSQADAVALSGDSIFKKRHVQELVISCGCPGSGKSSFFWETLQPQGYERVNQDNLKTRDRCLKAAREYLAAGSSVAIDNTNADIETRAHWIQLAQEFRIPSRCIRFTTPPRVCEHNDTVRSFSKGDTNPEGRMPLPGIAFRSFVQRFVEPSTKEGFLDITQIEFRFKGTEAHRNLWRKYWVTKFST